MRRLIASLVLVSCLTAFAPAPFPRPKRERRFDEISQAALQGTWRIVGMVRTSADGNHTVHKFSSGHVTVDGNRWMFGNAIAKGKGKGSGHSFAIDATKSPAHIDFNREGGGARGLGIIRRKGDRVEMLYIFSNVERAVDFDRPPNGQYLLTMERER